MFLGLDQRYPLEKLISTSCRRDVLGALVVKLGGESVYIGSLLYYQPTSDGGRLMEKESRLEYTQF